MDCPRIGYACISLCEPGGAKSTYTAQLATVDKIGLTGLKEIALKNVNNLLEILRYNESWGCRFFRITSNLFPHMGNPRMPFSYTIDFARKNLEAVGSFARENGHRLTMHPGQFAQLGSPRKEIVDQTIIDLGIHADILDAMGMKPIEHGSVMIIHGGGVFGSKEETLARFARNYRLLPEKTRQYVVLENDEYQYSVYDLLPFCEANGIPLCVDFFHHKVWSKRAHPGDEVAADAEYMRLWTLLPRIARTWGKIRPKCHLSEQKPGARDGAHSDCITEIPQNILTWIKSLPADIMLEVKDKDQCVKLIVEQQFETKIINEKKYIIV